jgi:ribulose bisphosphate carboxylase small subunit
LGTCSNLNRSNLDKGLNQVRNIIHKTWKPESNLDYNNNQLKHGKWTYLPQQQYATNEVMLNTEATLENYRIHY